MGRGQRLDLALRRAMPWTFFRVALGASVILAADDLLGVISSWPWGGLFNYLPPPVFGGWTGIQAALAFQSPLPFLALIIAFFLAGVGIIAGWRSSLLCGIAASILSVFLIADLSFLRDSRVLLWVALWGCASLGNPGLDAGIGWSAGAQQRTPRFNPRWIAFFLMQPLFYGGAWLVYRHFAIGQINTKRWEVAIALLSLPFLAGFRRARVVAGLVWVGVVLIDPLHVFNVSAIALMLGAAVLLAF